MQESKKARTFKTPDLHNRPLTYISEQELPGSLFIKTDVTSWKDLVAVFKKTVEKYGRVDVVFANAGEIVESCV